MSFRAKLADFFFPFAPARGRPAQPRNPGYHATLAAVIVNITNVTPPGSQFCPPASATSGATWKSTPPSSPASPGNLIIGIFRGCLTGKPAMSGRLSAVLRVHLLKG